MKLPIYLDHHATTPVDERVLEAMLPYFSARFGNAASRSHSFGWEAERAVERARALVAALVGAATPTEIVFTSGATEADNLAVKGVAELHRERGGHIVTTGIEHTAVLDTCRQLERQGFAVTYLPVPPTGVVDAQAVRQAITDRTLLVSVMLANGEVGSIQPIAAIGSLTRERGVLLHCDAAQGLGHVPLGVREAGVDLCSLSAHKIYGPKGVGALYVRRSHPRVVLAPQIHGGGHELGLRSGTLNVPGIVGFGRACELMAEQGREEAARLAALRDGLVETITAALEDVRINGTMQPRLPGNANLSFACVEAEALIMALKDDVALSSGSACSSQSTEPSHVLRALGLDDAAAHSSIRFGLGRFTTEEEADHVAARVIAQVQRLRRMSPLYEMYRRGSGREPTAS
ncbi:MAG: IscS subfamily cysteine desulfurase [Deltaproteobacteria bacterium]|nr:IscS subfamily cysteine desulfurase [Deltaproteobacteria bacterium]